MVLTILPSLESGNLAKLWRRMKNFLPDRLREMSWSEVEREEAGLG